MEEIESNNNSTNSDRPNFLTVLCILTFVSAGMGTMSSLITPPFAEFFVDFVNLNPSFDESMKTELITVFQAGWGYYLTVFILSASSLAGAVLMWNLMKLGFHFYALANLGLLFLPTLFLGITTSFGNILFTGGFIAMYALHLKLMK